MCRYALSGHLRLHAAMNSSWTVWIYIHIRGVFLYARVFRSVRHMWLYICCDRRNDRGLGEESKGSDASWTEWGNNFWKSEHIHVNIIHGNRTQSETLYEDGVAARTTTNPRRMRRELNPHWNTVSFMSKLNYAPTLILPVCEYHLDSTEQGMMKQVVGFHCSHSESNGDGYKASAWYHFLSKLPTTVLTVCSVTQSRKYFVELSERTQWTRKKPFRNIYEPFLLFHFYRMKTIQNWIVFTQSATKLMKKITIAPSLSVFWLTECESVSVHRYVSLLIDKPIHNVNDAFFHSRRRHRKGGQHNRWRADSPMLSDNDFRCGNLWIEKTISIWSNKLTSSSENGPINRKKIISLQPIANLLKLNSPSRILSAFLIDRLLSMSNDDESDRWFHSA